MPFFAAPCVSMFLRWPLHIGGGDGGGVAPPLSFRSFTDGVRCLLRRGILSIKSSHSLQVFLHGEWGPCT